MNGSANILIRFKRKWQLLTWLEVFLYAVGIAFLVYFLSADVLITTVAFVLAAVVVSLFIKPWLLNLNSAITYIDAKLDIAEYSTGLLLKQDDTLSGLAKLQRHKILEVLTNNLNTLKPPNNVLKAGLVMLALIFTGFTAYQLNLVEYITGTPPPKQPSESIAFTPIDSTEIAIKVPNIKSQSVRVRYPAYTNISTFKNADMNVKALEGSKLSWEIAFDMNIKDVSIESMGKSYPMLLVDGVYKKSFTVKASGFYNFKFIDVLGNEYTSKLYSIEMLKDKEPDIKINDIEQFTSFDFSEDMKLSFKAALSDDFGLADAYIIATVSKGSGESVKFREEKLNFDTSIAVGKRKQTALRTIQMESLKMEPGDELYFYIEALDYKKPTPNKARSETYFAVIKDTVSDQFAVEATMGVDLMPEFFRSQRQLIIDTEKLIKNKPKLSTKEFKFKSNELGFDQKTLRLKYAEFMGEETEGGESIENEEENPDHEEAHDEDDPLAEYTHDHDNENEHNLVAEKDKGKKNNPLEEFIHDHSDPEEATLFTESLKSKLRQALNEMWDSELYLRLYTPEKSLPYQYRALKLIQEIKNSARIYVHRIGFDPPPIKEDKRLSGKIDEVSSYRKSEDLQKPEPFPSIHKAIDRLEQLISENKNPTAVDKILFKKAGNELAVKAIENPGNYLSTLQQLKQIATTDQLTKELMVEVQKGLYTAIPTKKSNPSKNFIGKSEINELLINELNVND